MKTSLYPWQEECLSRWFANGGRGIVQAVTGSGKTRLALEAAAQLQKKTGKEIQVKIVVPTTNLMNQWNRALREFHGNQPEIQREIGLRGGGRKSQTNCRYMIYVINSARYELARQILSELENGKSVFLIADECHHYTAGENQLIFEFFPYIKPYQSRFFAMGLSATLPTGQAKNNLTRVLGRCIYSYGIQKALKAQTVCAYDIFHIEIELMSEEKREYEELTDRMRFLYGKLLMKRPELRGRTQKEFYEGLCMLAKDKKTADAKDAVFYMKLSFRRKEIVCLAAARKQCVVRLIELLGIHQKIIVFGERISQTEELYGILQRHFSGKVGRYHSKMGTQANKNALERFRDGETRILLACKSMDEGVDIPDASVGIILSGTSAQRQRTQRLGRIIRNAEGKDRAVLYYLHAAETSEDICFLPETEDNRIFELKYHSDTGIFSHEAYDAAAENVWGKIYSKNINHEKKSVSREMQKEIARCLYRGTVRTDWRLSAREIRRRISEAGSNRERNYWICMEKMHNSLL